MPIFRGDEDAAVEMIGRSMGLLAAKVKGSIA
jgi:hypothetical protein